MDDRQYIAKLERMLEERKDIINTLINICGELVNERDEINDYADRCIRDRVNESELLRMEQERFDALIEDYHCLDQRFCTEVRDHQEAQHKIKRLEGMVERRDKKIKDLTVERDIIKDACEDCNCVKELLAENEELKEKVEDLNTKIKDLNTKSDYLQNVIDSMRETDNEMLYKRDTKIHELAMECENLKKDLEVAKNYDSVCFGCSITESLVDENKHLREEVKYLNAIVDGAS